MQTSSANWIQDTKAIDFSAFKICKAGVIGILYRNLEIHHLLGESTHIVVEAESVFSWLFCCEDIIALSFFGALEDDR